MFDRLSHDSIQDKFENAIDCDSPRTQQVMFRLGLTQEDLKFRVLDDFKEAQMPESSSRFRYVKHLNRVATSIRKVKQDCYEM